MFVERKDCNNAKCPFCYNKDKRISFDKQQFLDNFIDSLDDIICRIGDKNHNRGDNKWMQLVFQYIVITYYSEYSGENEVKEGLDD